MSTDPLGELAPYLKSPKGFHLEMPLYAEMDLSNGTLADLVYTNLSHAGTIDAYCLWCGKESVFRAYNFLSDNIFIPDWRTRHNGLIEIEYRCRRVDSHAYHTYYFKIDNLLLKVGQYPSVADFQVPQAEKYRKILGEDKFRELTRGIGLKAHGVGIGSFVYLRRIFEDLIEESHAKAKEDSGFSESDYQKARMDEKIELLKDHLPRFLVENKNIYSILSKGIHDLGEEECLKYFDALRIGIEQILDEKIEISEKMAKAAKAREAIQGISRELAGEKT